MKILDRGKEEDMFPEKGTYTNRNAALSKTASCIVLGRVRKNMKHQGNLNFETRCATIFERVLIGLIPQNHSKTYITRTLPFLLDSLVGIPKSPQKHVGTRQV